MVLQISDLPEEMMIEIFKQLDGRSTKQAALVCSDWNRVIGTTPAIMEKFRLRIESSVTRENFKQLMASKRHFTSADIRNVEKNQLIAVAERFGSKLISLELHIHKLTSVAISKILKQMPELEYLYLVCSDSKKSKIAYVEPVTLKKLKKLSVFPDWIVLNLFVAPELVQLTLMHSVYNIGSFKRFLKASPKLKSLDIDSPISLGLFGKMNTDFPFQLDQLTNFNVDSTCDGYDYFISFKINDNIRKFLLSQAGTVKELEGHCQDSEFYEIILTKFKLLKRLDFDFQKLKASQDFYKNLKPMPLVTEIYSRNGFSSANALRAVVKNCPNLKKLYCPLGQFLPDELDFVAEHNRELTELFLKTIRPTNARFVRLHSLTVSKVELTGDIIDFLKTNLEVSSLKIINPYHTDLTHDLINETGLSSLSITGCKEGIRNVLRTIRDSGYGNLKSLTLEIDGRYSYHSVTFPDNPDEFNLDDHSLFGDSDYNSD